MMTILGVIDLLPDTNQVIDKLNKLVIKSAALPCYLMARANAGSIGINIKT